MELMDTECFSPDCEMHPLSRARCIASGEWVIGRYIQSRHGSIKVTHLIDTDIAIFEVDPETLGRCTGQRDKHKNMIFVGHRLRDQDERIGIVVFAYGAFRVSLFDGIFLKRNSSLLCCDKHGSESFEIVDDE